MRTWIVTVEVTAPYEIGRREIDSLVSDVVGDEVYNRYGKGNAVATDTKEQA